MTMASTVGYVRIVGDQDGEIMDFSKLHMDNVRLILSFHSGS